MKKIWICGVLLFSGTLLGDFYSKVPEFNPGDAGPGYDLFKPPWYPYNIEEAEKYTVDESGELIEQPEGDQGLAEYGKKKLTKKQEVIKTMKKVGQKLIFEKVISSPRVVVWDFYGHVPWLAFDLPPNSWTTGYIFTGGNEVEFGGYPPIPGDNRLLYDAWTVGMCTGWEYDITGSSWVYPKVWKGRLVPNLREFSVFLTTQGVAVAKHCAAIIERDVKKEYFNPGLAALKAMTGKDFKFNAGKWRTEYIDPLYNEKMKPFDESYDSWENCVRSLVMLDLTSKRVPARNAFHRLRDIPELSEPIFLDLIESGKASQIELRNLASLLGGFTSPRAAKALHKLARGKDPVVAIRAVDSLSAHPHGRVKEILLSWLEDDSDDVLRSKAILMFGRVNDPNIANKLMELYKKPRDQFDKELILRSLMRMAWEPAKSLFEENLKEKKYDQLAHTSKIGLFALGALEEGKVMKMIDESFYREDAIPMSGKAVSFAPKLRIDMIKYMAKTQMKGPRRRLWRYIREFKDLGEGSEVGGVPHILAYGLNEIVLGDDIISLNEAVKALEIMASRSSVDTQIRIAALGRLYELDSKKCLKICNKTIERFLKGRKIGDSAGNKFFVSELDYLVAALNLVIIDNPENESLLSKIMLNPNFDGSAKTIFLQNIYKQKRKLAINLVKKSLKTYTKISNLSSGDKQFLIRLIRFAGLFKDAAILKDTLKQLVKSSDPWLRFISLYSLRLGLESDTYGNVITGKSGERVKLQETFNKLIKDLKKK